MNRRCRSAAAAVAAIAACGLAAAVAQALVPPPGTPDLAKMTLQASDLAPGAVVLDGYVKPGAREVAQYDRTFTSVATTGGVKLELIQTQLALAASTPDATSLFKGARSLFASKQGRSELVAEVVAGAGTSVPRADITVHFGKLRELGIGDQSSLASVRLRVKQRVSTLYSALLRIGNVVATVTVIALRAHLAASVPTGLAQSVAAHITAVLAATGPTGPTGPTAATG